MNDRKVSLLRVTLPLTFLIMITVNALANAIPINGKSTGEISDYYANLFAPAGITFAIWGLIYILLAVFSIYFILKINQVPEHLKENLTKIGLLFSVSSVANSIWIFAWHYEVIWLSLIVMFIILVCLIYINLNMRNFEYSVKENLLIKLPFSVYFAWITVATIANVTTFLVSINWGQFSLSDEFWADVIILIGAIIAFTAILFYKSFSYGFVIIWAYSGILIKHLSKSGFDGHYPSVVFSTFISIFLIVVAEIILLRIKNIEKELNQ